MNKTLKPFFNHKIGRAKGFVKVFMYNNGMITLYTYKEFYGNKGDTLLPLQCEFCQKKFMKTKRRIQSALRGKGKDKCNFCSKSCASKSKKQMVNIVCKYCNNTFAKNKRGIKDGVDYCCSKSCALKNRHKKLNNRSTNITS